jgi:hypothetical protein
MSIDDYGFLRLHVVEVSDELRSGDDARVKQLVRNCNSDGIWSGPVTRHSRFLWKSYTRCKEL